MRSSKRLASPSEVARLYRLHMGNDDFLAENLSHAAQESF
jgi:hypothetical protein